MDAVMIEAHGLVKRYGAHEALAGTSFMVPAGQVLGVLGPNGAGKTTAVRILTTLTSPDRGHARVAGFDVVSEADSVRRRIGVAAQNATLDEALTGWQNMAMIGELGGLRRPAAKDRAAELLERFGLTDAASRIVKTYSGGMRRRLDLAASVILRPAVLFLDEPTTELDPASRQQMWGVIRGLVTEGATVLLTTQYLEEADQLADRIVVINHGRVVATGTSHELKQAIGGATLHVTITKANDAAVAALTPLTTGSIQVSRDGRQLHAAVPSASGVATRVVRALDAAGIDVDDVEVAQPSLDDVFFALTGRVSTDPISEISEEIIR